MGRTPDDRFRIFVSHKHTDAGLAKVIQEQIEAISPVFDCWVSGQDISAGSDWSRAILKALARSHLLILLFTVPERNWDWCLYEAGLFIKFANAAEEDVRSVVSIFDPKVGPPRPLAGVHGAAAEPDELAKFLTRLCAEPWEVSDDWRRGPITRKPDQARIASAAAMIAAAFETRISAGSPAAIDIHYPCHRVVLDAELDDPQPLGIPDDALVLTGDTATTSFTLALFGLATGDAPHTWSDLLRRVGGEDEAWRTEIDAAYAAAFREELFVPGPALIRAWDRSSATDRVYRPILYSVAPRDAGTTTRVQIVIALDPIPAGVLTT